MSNTNTITHHTFEWKRGYYHEGGRDYIQVYEWSTYPKSSVLAGQPRKVAVAEEFESEAAMRAVYPDAVGGGKWIDPVVSVPHCPDEHWSHYDCGEYWGEDDY